MKTHFEQADRYGNNSYLMAGSQGKELKLRAVRHGFHRTWTVKLYVDNCSVASIEVVGVKRLRKVDFNNWAIDNGFDPSQIGGLEA